MSPLCKDDSYGGSATSPDGGGNRRSWIQGEKSLIPFVAKKESLRTYIAIELYI